MERRTRTFEETVSLGEEIGDRCKKGEIIALTGALGSGKTSLVKGIARSLQIEETITSPSFTLVSEYRGRLHLYHMDLYRVDSGEEFELLGGEELLYGEGVTVIEWAEKVAEYLPSSRIHLTFRMEENGSRTIEISGMEL